MAFGGGAAGIAGRPGGHTGRPYAVFSAWSVGRGAHTPPNRTAGINRPAINAAPPSILS